MSASVIVAGARTPIGKMSGAFSSLSAADREAETVRLVSEEVSRPFDISTGPLFRAGIRAGREPVEGSSTARQQPDRRFIHRFAVMPSAGWATMVRCWENISRFDSSLGSLRTWLFVVARRTMLDNQRHRMRTSGGSERLLHSLQSPETESSQASVKLPVSCERSSSTGSPAMV